MADGGTLTIHLLGGFRITAGDQGVTSLEHARLQELLAFLLLQRGRPVSRQHLAFLLWPDSLEKQARTNLRNLWHRLRRTLPDAERYIDAGEATIQWRGDAPYTLDLAGFEAALGPGHGRIADAIPHARTLCAPEQQALPAALAEPLAAVLAAWDAGRPDDTREKLQRAVDLAQQMKYT
jgi:hypothetical protein